MIPTITNLQVFILSKLCEGPQSGQEIRAALKREGQRKSLAAFYQLMARMESAGLVTGDYVVNVNGPQVTKERIYRITLDGRQMLVSVESFHSRMSRGK